MFLINYVNSSYSKISEIMFAIYDTNTPELHHPFGFISVGCKANELSGYEIYIPHSKLAGGKKSKVGNV